MTRPFQYLSWQLRDQEAAAEAGDQTVEEFRAQEEMEKADKEIYEPE